ncbi:hypothetical protein TWF694_005193 [Orbilia ellipsospora]|uniref:Rhodopsin domain-containing protein n=1 Tax=Orbilia ellipsospora TaxID=2528407 RepID=A0AAV9WUU1_9PEZI
MQNQSFARFHVQNPTQAFEWSMIAATLCLVLLRLYLRFRRSCLTFFEDGFVLLAWLCFLSQVLMDTQLYRLGFFNEQLDTLAVDIHGEVVSTTALKIFYVQNATYHFSMYAVKSAMLSFYTHFIPKRMHKTRIFLWITAALVAGGFVVSTLLNLFLCLPLSRNWDPNDTCSFNWTSGARSIVSYVFHLLTDLAIYILPISAIRVLPLPTSQRIGVGATFVLGSFCIFLAIAVIVVGYVSSSTTARSIVATLEQTLCLCVVCVLAFKGLNPTCSFTRRKHALQMHWHREQRWRNRGERDSDSESDGGTTTCSTEDVTRPPSDATVFGHDDFQYTQYNTNSLKRQVESMMAYEDKVITSPTRTAHHHYHPHHNSPPRVTCTPIPSYNRQSHDTEYQMSNPSSPGYTMSIASIVDFYDLERQLQLDDERRQATNCSPVLERRSSELQYASSIPAASLSDSKLATTL